MAALLPLTAGDDGAGPSPMSHYERERQARIEANRKRMGECCAWGNGDWSLRWRGVRTAAAAGTAPVWLAAYFLAGDAARGASNGAHCRGAAEAAAAQARPACDLSPSSH